ncbi:DUF4414 domain-containing protein, partial [Staphylococcus aureus]|nr:DUF4414 domain-containing protein [Staphylococcus aureus]
ASTSQINPEFLDALPPDIRAEVIMQETMETARRNQQAAQAAQAAAAAQAVAAAQQQRINLGGPIAAGLPLPVGGGPLFDLEPELRS